MIIEALVAVLGIALGVAGGYFLAMAAARRSRQADIRASEDKAAEILREAERDAERINNEALIKAKETALRAVEKEERAKAREVTVRELEVQLDKRAETADRRERDVDRARAEARAREEKLDALEKQLKDEERRVEGLLEETTKILEQRAGMSHEQARQKVVEEIVEDARLDAAKHVKRVEEEAHAAADRKSKRIISTAIMRYAGEYASERTVSVVNLPSDEMKGRIIGREGRNIRAFEAASGIDLIIDDTPEAVILSGFDPVRREVARLGLEKLIADGRIHPTRIEEVLEKAQKDVDQTIREAGEFAVMELGLGSVHPELVLVLGRLKYRSSYGQNVLHHSLAVGFLAGMMMAELGLDTKLGRRAGLLHDIGKAVDHEVEGSHAVIGANLAKRYGEKPEIVHAIGAHHEDERPNSVLACLVMAADAISGARPGARRETLESYIRRLEDLEAISMGFKGVQKSFAIQAGRELRIMVESANVSDDESVMLARDVAKQIEEKLTYPGQIKVTVIRETRAVDFAR